MESLERVRSGGRIPLLILGEAGRWERLQFEENLGEVGTGRCERFRSENLGEAERWERFQTDQENEENQSEWVLFDEL